jgi:hypothetical protein
MYSLIITSVVSFWFTQTISFQNQTSPKSVPIETGIFSQILRISLGYLLSLG